MKKENGELKVVGLEIPNGSNAQGSKVKLSSGQYLAGIQSITLHADTDSKLWQLNLTMLPNFADQQVVEALLADVELMHRQSVPRRIHTIENQIIDLQNELNWLREHE